VNDRKADGQGVICRLQELSGQESDFTLRFNLSRVAAAEMCDITERPLDERGLAVTESSVSGRIGAHRLQTIRIAFKI
jgi:glycosyl hydrolase family 38